MRLLVAEDDHVLRDAIVKRLTQAAYSVDGCEDGAQALEYLELAEYDAAILDVMMPRVDGFSVVEKMRARGDTTPVLILTARSGVDQRVRGLDAGADDYLVKPFDFEELLARLRALTRRGAQSAAPVYTLCDLKVDARTRQVWRGGREISLTSREFSILEYMIRNQGVVLSRGQIESNIWSDDYEGASNMVDVYIRYLRRKIDQGFEPKLIHTVRYAGYVLRETP